MMSDVVVFKPGGYRYLKAVFQYSSGVAAEPGFESALAALVARVMTPREADPWERSGRRSTELRKLAVTVPMGFAPDLGAALARGGIASRTAGDSKTMLCCLDAAAVGARVGERPRAGEEPNEFLARLLPADSFTFWPADRF